MKCVYALWWPVLKNDLLNTSWNWRTFFRINHRGRLLCTHFAFLPTKAAEPSLLLPFEVQGLCVLFLFFSKAECIKSCFMAVMQWFISTDGTFSTWMYLVGVCAPMCVPQRAQLNNSLLFSHFTVQFAYVRLDAVCAHFPPIYLSTNLFIYSHIEDLEMSRCCFLD